MIKIYLLKPDRRATIFCGDFLQDLNVQIPFTSQLFWPRVLLLQLPQSLHIHRFQLPKALASGVDRHVADTKLLGHFRHRCLIGLTQNLDHLLFGKSGLLHGCLLPERHLPKESTGPKIG